MDRQSAAVVCVLVALALPAYGREHVLESARQIPVAYDVDVVVVGGTTGAVAAAAAAAKHGAKVFLAAPRPYLGEDMAAYLRLWRQDDTEPTHPLVQSIFADAGIAGRQVYPGRLDFTYEADLPSGSRHPDRSPPSLLCDGAWHSAAQQSVQYDGDVTVTVDLGQVHEVRKALVMYYHRVDYQLDGVTVASSPDKEQWEAVAVLKNEEPEQAGPGSAAYELAVPLAGKARYLRFSVKRAEGSGRVLLGEIVVIEACEPGQETAPMRIVRPLHVKKTLDDALLDAGVDFLFSTYATGVLRDAAGRPGGIVMANRAGRQAVIAKVIIDATDRAWVARMAGASCRPYPLGEREFRRVIIGGEVREDSPASGRVVGLPIPFKGGQYPVVEYVLNLSVAADSVTAWQELEQMARDWTYHPEQQFTSERLYHVPPDSVVGVEQVAGTWPGVDGLPLGVLKPKGVERVYVLGPCADVGRPLAAKLVSPTVMIVLGSRLGAAAADEASRLARPEGVSVSGGVPDGSRVAGEISEILDGARPTQVSSTIPQVGCSLPVLGRYDVVVVGGGTSGAPAGIAAARQGARTLVVEYLHGLGGVGTLGAISKYYHGYRGGFTSEVPGGSSWRIEQRAEWWRTEIRRAGGHIWFGALGCGAVVRDGAVTGVVVATQRGRGVVLARVVIDATGNADIAAAAGATCVYTDASDLAVQGTGLPPRDLGASYTNTDFTMTDETDMVDITSLFVYAKSKYGGNTFDQGQLIDTRERRRIVGEFTVTIVDQVSNRTYPDTVLQSLTNYDTHGYTVHPYFTVVPPPKGQRFNTFLPYRCLLPRGLEGILVIGLGVSVGRDAIPLIRMQPDLQNLGYAAGVIAAETAKGEGSLRQVDIRAIQRHLVDTGNLPEAVLTHRDSRESVPGDFSAVVDRAGDGYVDAAQLFFHKDKTLPSLRKAAADASTPERKLVYAHILATMGDASGVSALCEAVERASAWDSGWNFRAGGQFGGNMSQLDSYIYALGKTRDRRALSVILKKAELLDADAAFSHHRAVVLALESMADPKAAATLAEVLAKPDMSGHALVSIAAARESHTRLDGSLGALRPRRRSLREIMLARALYRCGDHDGIGGRILRTYTRDVRGHFARHAAAVLRERAAK